ncbi:MAG TPA: efflux RND transporter periplasmic adaptor subunit [bacterium]|nr:efflux RND transporter periplasmic adaptor subunit [bacterium]
MKKWIVIVLLILAAGLIGVHTARKTSEESGDVGFKTVPIKRGDLENIISSTGTLSAVSTVNVGSQVSGTLEAVLVDFNDRVTKGQVLARLDTLLLEANVRDAQASLQIAKAQYAQAKAELNRNRTLYDKGYLSESEYLTYATDLDVKDAGVAGAESALLRAKTNLSYGVITSPIDGIVIQRSVDPGQTIAASLQTPQLFIIAEDLRNMQIEVAVDESDIGSVTEGMNVRFEVQAYPDRVFQGEVRQVRLQPETISNVVNYTVIVTADNIDGTLLPGMTATVDFIVDQVADVVLVPNAAMKFQPDREMMAAIRNREESTRGPGTGGRAEELSHAYYSDASGNVQLLLFRPGVTDGAYTEVKDVIRGPETIMGLNVITSSGNRQTGSRPPGMIPMGGPPPGGGGMRRSGL